MLTKRLNVVNALLVIPMSYLVLRMGDWNLTEVAFRSAHEAHEKGIALYVADVKIGLFVVGPLAVGITCILFWRFKEQRTLANVMTVFSAVFGIFSCLYFLWTLRY